MSAANDTLTTRRRVSIYRDDSTTTVVYDDVKHVWWEAGNSVFVVAYFTDDSRKAHDYAHWPRERICWIRDEKVSA